MMAWYQSFESELSLPQVFEIYAKIERQLSALDAESWVRFKTKARALTEPLPPNHRRWQFVFDLLSEAAAFDYLLKRHCTDVEFVLAGGSKTPDLSARRDDRRVLCEVKTINVSDKKAEQNHQLHTEGQTVVTENLRVDRGFLRKIDSDLKVALDQLAQFDSNGRAEWVIFVCLNMDDRLGTSRPEHLRLIDEHLSKNPVLQARLVFYFLTNYFERNLSMQMADVYSD